MVKNAPDDSGPLGDSSSIPGLVRSPAGGSGNPLQYNCWDNPMESGDWLAPVHGVVKSQTRLSDWARMLELSHADHVTQ